MPPDLTAALPCAHLIRQPRNERRPKAVNTLGALSQQVWTWAVVLFVMGFIPGRHTDNWAHLGGYLGGWIMARWLDPLRAERGDHILLAVLCLVATVAAVVASVITGLPLRSAG